MIASGQNIDTSREEIVAYGRCDTKSTGRVLAVHHQKIEIKFPPKDRHLINHGLARGATNDISQKQNPHTQTSQGDRSPACAGRRPDGVKTASSGTSKGPTGTLSTSCPSKAMPIAVTARPSSRSPASVRS